MYFFHIFSIWNYFILQKHLWKFHRFLQQVSMWSPKLLSSLLNCDRYMWHSPLWLTFCDRVNPLIYWQLLRVNSGIADHYDSVWGSINVTKPIMITDRSSEVLVIPNTIRIQYCEKIWFCRDISLMTVM